MLRLRTLSARCARCALVAWSHGGPAPPKPFAILCCLVAQAGRLVTKDALLQAVWPETAVQEDVITVAIGQLRQILGDRARTPRFIETVYGRGYRFIAPVAAAASSPDRPRIGGGTASPARRCVRTAADLRRA